MLCSELNDALRRDKNGTGQDKTKIKNDKSKAIFDCVQLHWIDCTAFILIRLSPMGFDGILAGLDEQAMRFVPQPNTHIPSHHFLPVAIGKLEKLRFRSNTATR